MKHLTIEKINNYDFFVIRRDLTNKVVDFFVFSESNYIPNIEKYIFGIIKKVIEFECERGDYSSRNIRFVLSSMYKIDILDNRRIDFSSCRYFFEYKDKASKEDMYEVLNALENKQTEKGLINTFEKGMGINLRSNFYLKIEKELRMMMQGYNTSNLSDELKKYILMDAYEKAKSNNVEFLYSINKAKQMFSLKELE